MNLRDLTHEQNEILKLVQDGDLTEDEVKDHLESLTEDREAKIESYLFVIAHLTAQHDPVTVEIERLKSLAESRKKEIQRVKDNLLFNMADKEKFQFDLFKVSRVKGRAVAVVTDETLLGDYSEVKVTSSVNKRLLLADLKEGKEIEGAELGTGDASLRIS